MRENYIPKEGERFLAFDKFTGKPHRCNPFVCNKSNKRLVGGGSCELKIEEWRFEKAGRQ